MTSVTAPASPYLQLGVDESIGANEVVAEAGLAMVNMRHDAQVTHAVLPIRGVAREGRWKVQRGERAHGVHGGAGRGIRQAEWVVQDGWLPRSRSLLSRV